MFGLNKSQLKNGLILALILFLITQVFKEYKTAMEEEDFYQLQPPFSPVPPKYHQKAKKPNQVKPKIITNTVQNKENEVCMIYVRANS